MREVASTVLGLFLVLIISAFNSSYAQERITLNLDKCVDMALKNNEEVLKAKGGLKEAESVTTMAHSDEFLLMNFTSFYQRTKANDKFEAKEYNGTLHAEQLLTRFGAVPSRLDSAQEMYRQAELALLSTQINVVSQARQIFYDIILIQDEMKDRKTLRDEIETKRARTKERVKENMALELDLLDVELELAQQELRLNELKRELSVKKAELLQVIGADEEAELIISGELVNEEFNLEDCIKLAMDNRIEPKDIRGQIARQERIVKEVYWELLPELKAQYRYKDASLILEQADKTWDARAAYDKPIWSKENGLTPERNKWELSFSLGFLIYDGFRLKGRMELEEARLDKLRLELIQKEKQIRLEVRNAYQEMINQKENMDIKEKLVNLRRKTLERMEIIMETPIISQKYPRLAGITFDDVIRARESYTEAQGVYFAQKRSYILAQEELRRLMGVM